MQNKKHKKHCFGAKIVFLLVFFFFVLCLAYLSKPVSFFSGALESALEIFLMMF